MRCRDLLSVVLNERFSEIGRVFGIGVIVHGIAIDSDRGGAFTWEIRA